MTDQTKDLKPCPFCGGVANLNQHEGSASNIDDINSGAQWIECTKCGASTNLRFSLLDDCRPLLAEQWNRRASATSAPVQPTGLPSWWSDFVRNVAELPDRNSPEGEPDAMIATSQELADCAISAMGELAPISRAEWMAQAKAFYIKSGDDETTAHECAKYLCNQQDWAGSEVGDPRYEAQEDVQGRGRTGVVAMAHTKALPDHAAQVIHMVGQPLTDEQIHAASAEWLDISTAPRDGTVIRVAALIDGKVEQTADMQWSHIQRNAFFAPGVIGMWVCPGGNFTWKPGEYGPTHWQPLPPPPNAQGAPNV